MFKRDRGRPLSAEPAREMPSSATVSRNDAAKPAPERSPGAAGPSFSFARISVLPPAAAIRAPVRELLERRVGTGLRDVHLHRAADAAAKLKARAFTVGRHIFFGAGESPDDLRLLAHEATHVRQQRGNSVPAVQCQSHEGNAAAPEEQAADANGAAAVDDIDEAFNRAGGWIHPGGHGNQANLRRMLRCGDTESGCSEADLTLYNHPWFQQWYIHGVRWLRSLPAAEREEAVQFLLRMNTNEGRQRARELGDAWLAQVAMAEGGRSPAAA
ncbi:MAG: hypothetical protein JWO56_90, partial [Acidobacteria bacterium]|nr:hypothetical protein [Acidobacteriota bacterium]